MNLETGIMGATSSAEAWGYFQDVLTPIESVIAAFERLIDSDETGVALVIDQNGIHAQGKNKILWDVSSIAKIDSPSLIMRDMDTSAQSAE